MKVALIGASGFVGSALLSELLMRGHAVTAIVRHPEKITPRANLQVQQGDVMNSQQLSSLLANHDAIISAYNGFSADLSIQEGYDAHLAGSRSIIQAIKNIGFPRLLMVGGAGSLEVAPGQLLLDTPEFPTQWREMALAMTTVLQALKNEFDLNWTFFSPAASLVSGKRTGKFTLGGNQPIRNAQSISEISVEDYAMAMIDELENPQHLQQRFTIGYT